MLATSIKKGKDQPPTPSDLVSVSHHPSKITYYCSNGQHNIKHTTHTKECYAEHPHLRQPRQEKERKLTNPNKPMPSLNLSSSEALETLLPNLPLTKDWLLTMVPHTIFSKMRSSSPNLSSQSI
ncbi:hypothetical protein O181_018471 [Austropuccinia psidii MF-1]|uniref:Uncharacterized protein n=1 Tax=Austropuccinia psidii MF-1 TaxID=1389203 RepID=A0A9Q3C5D6_9BASI|nr:hypothetical protein [Austropuccinia psidii MF-1]